MARAKVQTSFGIHTIQVPGSVTLSAAPTAGNLIVAFLGVNIAKSSIALSSSWKLAQMVGDPTQTVSIIGMLVYRYAVSGDGAALPAFFTSGTTYWTHAIYEVSGVSGTWADDMLAVVARADLQNNLNDSEFAWPSFPTADGALALTAGWAYNGNANPSITGSWTTDSTANNASNYGSLGSASRTMAPGDTIDGAWTLHHVASFPFAAILLILGEAPPSARYPRNLFVFDSFTAGHPTTPTLPFTPEVGNLLVAYIGWGGGTATNPAIDTSNWTQFKVQNHTTNYKIGLYRYVQPGDTATLPNLTTSGSAVYSLQVLEVSGVIGDFAADHLSSVSGYQDNATPFITTADTTSEDDVFAFISYGEFGSNGTPSISSPWSREQAFANNLDYGADVGFIQFFPSSGSTVQATITPGTSSLSQGYIQTIFGGSLTTFTPPPFLRVD